LVFVCQIIQSFYWKQQKHLFFYFGTRPLEILTHPTKIQVKDHPAPSISLDPLWMYDYYPHRYGAGFP
jgi:hypothetical protein